jgi:hypothetical protein
MEMIPQAKQPGPVAGNQDRAGENGMQAIPNTKQLQNRVRAPFRVLMLESPKKTQWGMLSLLSMFLSFLLNPDSVKLKFD